MYTYIHIRMLTTETDTKWVRQRVFVRTSVYMCSCDRDSYDGHRDVSCAIESQRRSDVALLTAIQSSSTLSMMDLDGHCGTPLGGFRDARFIEDSRLSWLCTASIYLPSIEDYT